MKSEMNHEETLDIRKEESANSLEIEFIPDKKLSYLFNIAEEGIIFGDGTGKITSANLAACRIFECSHQDLIGKNFWKLRRRKDEQYQPFTKDSRDKSTLKSQIFIQVPSGKEKLVEVTCKMHETEGYYLSIFRDITERYHMEINLQEKEQKFRRIFEDSIDGLILWDNKFRIVDINGAGEKIMGFSKANLIGKSIYEPYTEQKEAIQAIIEHLNQATEHENKTSTITYEYKDGKKKHVEFTSKLNIIDGLNFSVIKDVSQQLEMQEQLRKSDRLNVIGELAAGIAHEIRNPMTALKGFIQLLEGSIKKEHAMYYQVINSELARIDSIINEFLILAKPQVIRFQEKNINQIMRETVDLLNAQAVLYNVEFKTKYDVNLPEVYCEPNQLKKVFINIIKNAIEVMPEGGNISITTCRMEQNQIKISIQDEGKGIPKEKIKKLGEPFYTTKERGTGLGLMVSYKIIEEHRGVIQIESEEGKGTIFYITLPLDLKNRI